MALADRLKADDEAANKILQGEEPVEAPAAVIEPTPEIPEVPVEPKPEGVIPSVVEPAKVVEDAEAIIKGLKMQLDDENNPTYKQKYSTLQGMYNKLNEDTKELKAQAEKPSAPEVPETPSASTTETLSKLKQDYGEDIADVFKGFVKDALNELLSGKLEEQGKRIDTVEASTERTELDIFHTNLTNRVPDWKQINGWESEGISADPKWFPFLDQTIPGTVITYEKAVKDGYAVHNLEAVARVFEAFKDANKPTLALVPEVPAVPVVPEVPAIPDINAHIDPDTSGAGGPVKPNEKKTYSQAVVDKFYTDYTRKRFYGTQAEFDAQDAEYQLAMAEGRVT